MEDTKTITTNKKAYHEYFVIESFEAGISLSGTEIKSIRQGGVNLKDAWCSVDNGEMKVAFSMFPTSMNELMDVADEGMTMPPKSTWFEPKLRSGLFIHDLG